jgi:3-hydroxybutyryl-CoA dehydratase
VSRALPPGRYGFEALAPGDWWETDGIVVGEAQVAAFAGLSGDFFRIHMDDAAARALGFPGRVAHGLLGLALVDGLKNRAAVQLDAIASLGWEWRFAAPILLGDRIAARIEVEAVRASGKPGRGIARLRIVTTNQSAAVVQEGINTLMLAP